MLGEKIYQTLLLRLEKHEGNITLEMKKDQKQVRIQSYDMYHNITGNPYLIDYVKVNGQTMSLEDSVNYLLNY